MSKFLGLDMTEVSALSVQMLAASAATLPAAKAVIEKGALQVKNGARGNIMAADLRGRLKHYPQTITYDVEVDPKGRVEAEIGPDKDLGGQAHLGNVLEYGTSRGRPVPHLQPALEREAPVVEAEIVIAVGRLLWVGKHP